MPKPILIIKVDRVLNDNSMCQIISGRVEKAVNHEYHVLVIPCLAKPEPEFQALNPDTVEQTDIDTIREMIKNLMNGTPSN